MKKLAGFLLVVFFLSLGTASANAATLNGWAWSETFGWISFNSADPGAGAGPYAVTISISGNWSGYAWSEYLGWISFNAADIPSVCSATPQAHLDSSTGQVTGWAYAMAYATSAVPADGCIELSGTNHASPIANGTGGVTYIPSTGKFTGYAWGGDTINNTGPGWIQFSPPVSSPSVSAECLSAECGYIGGGAISGSCIALPPYQDVPPNTTVIFEATPTGGHQPYYYQWNGEAGWDTQTPPKRFSVSYSASAWGPHVIIKDKDALLTPNISCPFVSVVSPAAPTLKIGKTAATAVGSSLSVRPSNPFVLLWNFTLTSDYSCDDSVSPDPNNWDSGWNLGQQNNGNQTRTWDSGMAGTSFNSGTTPGVYQFLISCTSNQSPTPNPPASASATLKVNSSSESEI